MAEVYIYRPDCTDFSTVGECGRLDASLCDCEMEQNGMIELTLEHPIDARGRHLLIQENWILKTEIPVLTTPELDNGVYITNVQSWTVKTGLTKAQRTVYKSYNGDKKKKVLKARTQVTVTKTLGYSTRYKIKAGKVTGWIESEALEFDEDITIPDAPSGMEKATPSWELKEQCFRIYNVDRQDEKVTANARHISYDLSYNSTKYDAEGEVTLQQALDGIASNLRDDSDANFYTDILDKRVGVHAANLNPIEALLEPDEGLVARWHAQLVRDDMDFYLLSQAGTDRGIRIEYAQNLTGVHMSTNIDSVCTHVLPIGEQKNGKPLYLTDNNGLVACPSAGSWPFKRIYPLKVSEAKVDGKDVTVALARTRLRNAANDLIETGIDAPKIDCAITFESLGRTERFRQYRELKNRAFLYDTIHVWHPVLGIDMTAQVTKIKWDCLREDYKDMDIGDLEDRTPSVGSWQISGQLNGNRIIPGTIQGGALAYNAIATEHLQADSVDAEQIRAGAVTARTLHADSMTAWVLAAVTAHINALTAQTITTDELYASYAHMFELVADKLTAQGIQTDRLAAAMAEITVLAAGTATFDRATVQHLVAEAMSLSYGVGGDVFIDNLRVAYAQMVSAAIGNLCIRASDGEYYQIDVGRDGTVTATPATVTDQEAQEGQTASGRTILDTDIVAENLSTTTLLATYALINQIDAARIDVDQLFAREAFIERLNTTMITSDTVVNILSRLQGADDLAEQLRLWFSFDSDEGLVIQRRDEDGLPASIWSTVTDEVGYHIRRADLMQAVFSAYRDRVRVQNLEIGDIVVKPSSAGGWVWTERR